MPIITTAHAPSAGNNTYWPELYFNQSMMNAEQYGPYRDSPAPRVFGNASSLDPRLFLSINEAAEELLTRKTSGKYSPVEVAQWIEDYAAAGREALRQADSNASGRGTAAYRRMRVDVQIQAGLGEFFGAKFRGGVLFHLYEVTGNRAALEAAIAQYRRARAAWAMLAGVAKGVYMTDITLGEEPQLRGHWLDRLPAMDGDIAALESLTIARGPGTSSPGVAEAMRAALGRPQRLAVRAEHTQPVRFTRGSELPLTLSPPADTASVWLHYRRVDQSQTYITAAMERQGGRYAAVIPAAYTQTNFPLEYFFEVSRSGGAKGLFPGFTPELTDQPYFVVRSMEAT